MIFVTVGTDQPFDRMMKIIDQWAFENHRNDVYAQIGKGGWQPSHMKFSEFLEPPRFKEYFAKAGVVVAHAGMGTILSALHYGKPILVMPKRASLGEQRNEHQLATARRMMELGNVEVAFNEQELWEKLDKLGQLVPKDAIGSFAEDKLIAGLKEFISGN